MTAQEWFNLLIYVTCPAAIAYPLLYGFRSPWWTTHIGRALLLKAVGIAILLSFSVLYNLFGPGYWGRDVWRIGGMACVCIGVWYALIALLQVQRRSRR
jgi:hypothetical protein